MTSTGNFNEDVSLKIMQDFVIEIRLFDTHDEMSGANALHRDAAWKYVSKWIDLFLATEGALSVANDAELVEYNEIVDSDHKGCLVYIDV